MTDKVKKILIWVLAGLVAFVFIGSGAFKISGGNAEMVKGLGGATHLYVLGSLELVIAILFLYPRTGVLGALLGIAYMGGAMAVHLVSGQSIMLLVIIEVLIWITSALRFPELLERIKGT